MKRRLVKTASGTVLHNSSPAAIEEVLVGTIQEALGQWKNAVRVKPFLRIEDEDLDLSGNVKNAFGALELNAYGTKLYIPFIIADKTLLPFDTIRLGEEEISYDYSKLRRVVNAIEHKAKTQSPEGEGFETMEVAKFDDIQPNNGFLGSIMAVRDNHRTTNLGGDTPWSGPGFGVIDDQRMLRTASFDVLEAFQSVMEKIAETTVYSAEQIQTFAEHLQKKAEAEEMEQIEKVAAAPDNLEAARVKRDMIQLSEEKLFNIHRSASGNDIAFPIFEGGRFEYRMGRVYREFESWFQKSKEFTSGKIDAFVVDSKGGYCLLKSNQPFMASLRDPGHFEFKSERTRGLQVGSMYLLEKDTSKAFVPFTVTSSYLQDVLHDGKIVVSVRERSNGNLPSKTGNSLFFDVFCCQEIVPGRWTKGALASAHQSFAIVVTKDPSFQEPTFMTNDEIREYVTQKAKDPQDARLAMELVLYRDNLVLLSENASFFKLEQNITNYYTAPDGLFKEGPLSKVAAAYGSQNKARLVVKSDRQPKVYAVEWQFTRQSDAGGVDATKIERRSVHHLSKDQAQAMLGKLGFDHRTQAKFFEISDRNGRGATFDLPNPELASKVSAPDASKEKVSKTMKGLADSMLHSKNFMPVFEDAISSGLAVVIGNAIPNSINTANSVVDAMGWDKKSYDVAVAMEKVATTFNGAEWHELSALLNMKHRLDKIAQEVLNGSYVQKGYEVFEKVAEFKPVIEKKTKDLIEFNRKQLLKTSSYLVAPELVKEALEQLDGLYAYATNVKKKELSKEAGFFSEGPLLSAATKKIGDLEASVQQLQSNLDNAHARLRAHMQPGADSTVINEALQQVKETESLLHSEVEQLQQAFQERGLLKEQEAKRNMTIGAGVGVPGLVGLSYAFEQGKQS